MAFLLPALPAALTTGGSVALGAAGPTLIAAGAGVPFVTGINAGAALGALGSAASIAGTIAQGRAANAAAQQDALNAEAAGREERAAAQRDAEQKRREGAMVMSRQQALAAASGAGAGAESPTIVRLMTDTASDAALGAAVANYGGESRQRGYIQTARARRAEGRASLMGSYLAAGGRSGELFGGLYTRGRMN